MNNINPLKGSISLPGDKSISHRAAMFSVLAQGTSTVENVSTGGDVASTISVLKQLGADINLNGTTLITNGKGLLSLKGENLILDCGNSGTSLRLFCGLLSGQKVNNISLLGDISLSKRPQDRVVKPLQSMGVDIVSTNGLTPVIINESTFLGGLVESDVTSAQVKSAILLAGLYSISPVLYVEEVLTRDHTENMLRAMGVDVQSEITSDGYKVILRPPSKELKVLEGKVPGDPSSAAFFGIAAALIPGSDITLVDILGNDTRIGWIKVLQAMGANIDIVEKESVFGEKVIDVRIQYGELNCIDVEGSEISSLIDELPILTLAMAKAKGTSKVRDASELRVKESDRISVVLDHLNRMNITTHEYDDGYDIIGPNNTWEKSEINANHDHRISMTFIIANYIATGVFAKGDEDIINTSFPSFFDLFEQVLS